MRYRIALPAFLILIAFAAVAREPDLSRYKTSKQKLQAWAEHCDYLLGNEEGAKEDYPGLVAAGRKGMQMTPASDAVNKSLFAFYIGVGFEYTGVEDSAVHYYKVSERYAKKAKNSNRLINAQRQLIGYGTDEEKEAIAQKMLQMRDTTRDPGTRMSVLDILYTYYRAKNRYEQAIHYGLQILEIRKEDLRKPSDREKDPANFINIGVGLIQVGDMYNRMGQNEKALEYFREALYYTGSNYMDGAAAVYNGLLSVFINLQQMDSAGFYYSKVYSLEQEGYNNKESLSNANRSFAQYYADEGDMDKALAYGQKAYALSVSDGGDLTMLESNTVMGKVYFKRKEYQSALKHLLAVPFEARDYDKESYNELQFLKAECYAALGDWQKATEAYRDFAHTKDTLLSEAGKRNIAEMEAKFQNKSKQQQIDDARKQQAFLIAGIVLLLVILLLLLINYRMKQRNARVMDAKNAALYEANKTKATLFSVISHDLRSPISQLYQYLELQKNNPELLDEEMKRKHSERIGNATASLLETMEDMLVWSKTQMERFVPSSDTVQVKQTIQDTITLLGPDIEAKALLINNNISASIFAQSDANLLKIITRNLLLNAIQYSTPDSIIDVDAVRNGNAVTISVKDQGLGMSDDIIALLQSNEQNLSSNKKGLGWALIKEMAASVGATIDIQRNVPRGTIVSLYIPDLTTKA